MVENFTYSGYNLQSEKNVNLILIFMSVELLKRITINPEICHGKPTIRGLRYPVEMILELMAGGMTTAEILGDYTDLQEKDILACLEYAAKLTQVNSIYRIAV